MRKTTLLIAIVLSLGAAIFAQPGTISAPKYMGKRAADPASCVEGSWYYNTVSHAFKYCSAANTWSAMGGGGGGLSAGSAVSGGGINRVLFEDGSQNLATSANLTYGAATNQFLITATNATDNPFRIKLAASPAADAFSIFASDGTTKLANFTKDGFLQLANNGAFPALPNIFSQGETTTGIGLYGANSRLTIIAGGVANIGLDGNNATGHPIQLGSGSGIGWETTASANSSASDSGLKRSAAAEVQVTDGTTGVGNLKAGNVLLQDDTSPSNFLTITDAENLTADHTLSLNTNNADRTVSLSGNLTVPSAATVSGTNTGDQTLASLGAAASGANTDITSVLLNQTGLVVKGATSNGLTIKPNETLTAGRVLNIVTGDATRTLTFTGDASITGTNTGDQVIPGGNSCTNFNVSGSDATTTGASLVDVTGLVTGTLLLNTNYVFNATLYVTTTAVTTGTEYGTNISVAPTRTAANYIGPTTVASSVQTMQTTGTNANNIATPAFLTTASEEGVVQISGFFTTAGSGSPVFSLRHLKVTSGTSTVKIGSVMTVCKQ